MTFRYSAYLSLSNTSRMPASIFSPSSFRRSLLVGLSAMRVQLLSKNDIRKAGNHSKISCWVVLSMDGELFSFLKC